MNPETAWDRVSLEEVEDVTDLKRAIKKKESPILDNYAAMDLVLKATKKVDDDNQAVELDARKDLASVLKDFDVQVPDASIDSVQKSFAKNLWLFVNAPAGKYCESIAACASTFLRLRLSSDLTSPPTAKLAQLSILPTISVCPRYAFALHSDL